MSTCHAKAVKIQRLTDGASYDWRASCSTCGWYGVTRDTQAAAEEDVATHKSRKEVPA